MPQSSRNKTPVIGVLIASSMKITSGTINLVKVNKKAKTTLYFFSRKDVNFSRKTVKGMYYDYDNNRWRKKYFPIPDVLYVRGATGETVNEFIKRFDGLGIPRINPVTTFNKGELYSILKEDENISPHLPYTVSVSDLSNVKKYVRKMRKVYVKARYGRRGTQVMRVKKFSGGGYKYSYSILGDMVIRRVSNSYRLNNAMKSFFDDNKVIVQQAIDLIRVNGNRRVDFRAELQRNSKDEVEIVAIPIRVGQSKSPITTHGAAYQFDDYLEKLLPDYSEKQIKYLKQEINEFLFNVYDRVENYYGKFGEIGIDFAVDREGKIWFIECNAQSAKVSVGKAYGSDIVNRIYLNPLEYAKTLAENRSGHNSDHQARPENRSGHNSDHQARPENRSGHNSDHHARHHASHHGRPENRSDHNSGHHARR